VKLPAVRQQSQRGWSNTLVISNDDLQLIKAGLEILKQVFDLIGKVRLMLQWRKAKK